MMEPVCPKNFLVKACIILCHNSYICIKLLLNKVKNRSTIVQNAYLQFNSIHFKPYHKTYEYVHAHTSDSILISMNYKPISLKQK